MRVAVVGATGEVGRTMVRVLQEQGVRPEVIRFFASKNSAGTTVKYFDQDVTVEELTPIYERIGTFMADKCAGYIGGLITGNPDLAKVVPLYYSHRVTFFNGPIDCRLFVYPDCRLKTSEATAKPYKDGAPPTE